MIAYQTKNKDFIQRIKIRKVSNIKHSIDMLREIERTATNPTDDSPIMKLKDVIVIVDFDNMETYDKFLDFVKDLGMTKTNYHYVLATLV
jgi:hypothetical protein